MNNIRRILNSGRPEFVEFRQNALNLLTLAIAHLGVTHRAQTYKMSDSILNYYVSISCI
jgi:hypothetical protein